MAERTSATRNRQGSEGFEVSSELRSRQDDGLDQCCFPPFRPVSVAPLPLGSHENYLHSTWAIAVRLGVDLAWTPSIAIRHLSAQLMSSDEIKKCHPETRQVKRNF